MPIVYGLVDTDVLIFTLYVLYFSMQIPSEKKC